MAKTSRVEYLIGRINSGEITDDEWAEVEEITMGRPADYTPIIPGTDYDPIPAEPDVPPPRHAETPKSASPVKGGFVYDPTDPRVAQLEATVIDLVRRVKALEDRVIGEKT